jgi:hypothetical protein
MKKNIKFLCIAFAALFISCESVLDKDPLDKIAETAVWTDENLADAYLTDVYSNVLFRELGDNTARIGMIGGLSDEMTNFAPWQEANAAIKTPMNAETLYGPLNYWKYNLMRKINTFIEEVEKSEFDDAYKTPRLAEARWMRAYIYFEMVKRYGGIPLITYVQQFEDDPETIFVPRNTEQEVYDFIDAELTDIFDDLPESYNSELGRATKWAALALQSRSNLYAASIARFSTVQLDGVVGIPSGLEMAYWQKSYDASKILIEEGPHSLYRKNPDPVLNYRQLFIDEIEGHPEAIFTERYDPDSDMGHSFASLAVHADFATSWNSNFRVYLNIVEKFEFADGTSGAIPRSEYASKEWTMDELFHNRDPRFKASILYNESTMGWKANNYDSNIAYFHERSKVNGAWVKAGVLPNGVPAKASNRSFEPRPKPMRQGFLLRKYLDESTGSQLGWHESGEDFHIFRLGETYLNLAEAAYYLGYTGEALDAINEIRDRAGMPDKLAIDEDVIRNERAVELVFEEHRFWDLRRWRIANEVLDGKRMQGLKFEYNYDTDKYIIGVKNSDPVVRDFKPEHYYYPLTLDKLSDNPKLVENPGY